MSVLQPRDAAQPQDEEFARLVKEWTTRPEFSSPLVDHLPRAAGIPSPKDVLGHHVGAPKKLTYYADILKYYRALAGKTPRVKVMSIGKTDEGRDYVVVFVGQRGHDQEPRPVPPVPRTRSPIRGRSREDQVKQIIGKAKPIYHLMGGLHSGETGHSGNADGARLSPRGRELAAHHARFATT